MRRLVVPLLLAGALVAPASSAAFTETAFDNQCQYSYDRYWRPVPIIFGGKLTDGAGIELASGTQLAVGDTVHLKDGTVSAALPSWILPFAYESGMIPVGDGELPVRAWLALEATNTAEGVTPPIELTTIARTQVVLTPSGLVDEEASSIYVVGAPIPEQTWTATGGEVSVRQALGETIPPLPVGRNGADVEVRGSLYVEATLLTYKLYLDCLQGEQTNQGGGHTDNVPGPLGVFGVPGYTGTVGAAALPGAVDADLLATQGPPRALTGEQATVRGAVLRLRLTAEQREAWLGEATGVPVAGELVVHGERSAEGSQTVAVSGTAGGGQITLALADSTWTAATDTGVDLRGESTLSLDAQVGGETRTLTLTRIAAGDPYPFARILRAAAPLTPLPPSSTPTPTPTATPAATATPAPTVTPVQAAKVSVRSTRLKVASRRVAVALRCGAGTAACRGTVRLRTASKVKLGSKRAVVTMTQTLRYSLPAGGAKTVKLTLSAKGRSLLRARKSVSVNVELRPTGAATVKRKLTLRR